MPVERNIEDIYSMVRYTLNLEEGEDENLVMEWTMLLKEMQKIASVFPKPTVNGLTINNDPFIKNKLHLSDKGHYYDTNLFDKEIKKVNPDIVVYGNVIIENMQGNLTVIGNVNGTKMNLSGDLKCNSLVNWGELNLDIKGNVNTDDVIHLNGKTNIKCGNINCTEIIGNNVFLECNEFKSTFYDEKMKINESK